MSRQDLRRTAAELRETFDATFSQVPSAERSRREEFLVVRVHKSQVALRLTQIAGVQRCPPLTALPSGNTALVGLAPVRGALVAVYSLATFLGLEQLAPSKASILMCASDRSVALLFDELIGVVRVASEAIHSGGAKAGINTGEILTIESTKHIVIGTFELLEAILRTAHRSGETA